MVADAEVVVADSEEVLARAEVVVADSEEVVAGAEVGEAGPKRGCCLSGEEEAVANGGQLACPELLEVAAGEDEDLASVLGC